MSLFEDDQEHVLAAAEEYNYNIAGYPQSVLDGLNELRDDAALCDVILRVGEQTFPVHRCVLAAFSPYFKAMFTSQLKQSRDHEVTLNDIKPEILETLLKCSYTGAVSITPANVQNLMAASNLLQVVSVRDACSLFMEKHMDASNCLGVLCFAKTMDCERLQDMAEAFALSNFADVAAHEEFLNLPSAKLVELVSSDALDVPREEDVFTAVLNWFSHQPDARKEEFHKFLEIVRLPLISPHFLRDSVAKQELVQTSFECYKLLQEALLYQLLPDRREEMEGVRFRPRRSASLVDVIVCAGGYDDRKTFDCVEAFDPASNQWTSLAKLPSAFCYHGAAFTEKNVLYVAGGEFQDGTISDQLLTFDSHLNTWEEMASMSSARSEYGMAVLDGFVYAVGGRNSTGQLDSFERYNTETNTWEQLPDMNTAVSSAAVVAHDGYLYVAGGLTGGRGTKVVQRFDPRTKNWAELAPMLNSRYGSAACVLDEKLYIMGGDTGRYTNTVDCYDIQRNQWSHCSPMRAARYLAGAAAINGHVYVFGGSNASYTIHKSVERYTPSTDRWEDATDMPTARYGLTCTALQVPRSLLDMDKR